MSLRWMALESNPEVMNKLIHDLGVPASWGISDVYGLDDDLLSLIPSPSLALLLLFPVNDGNMDFKKQKQEQMVNEKVEVSKKVYFIKQFIRNACGTVALIHAIANNKEALKLDKDSVLGKFLGRTEGLNPDDRGDELQKNADISEAHETVAEQGQTEAIEGSDYSDFHFVTLVNVDDNLYELDGRMDQPLCHGPTSADTFLRDAAKVCKEFMQRDPNTLNFTVLAFGPLVE